MWAWGGSSILREFPLKWTIWWLLVPNLAMIAMWPIGGPAMGVSITVCGLASAFVAQLRNEMMQRFGIALIFTFNVLMYIAYSFNLSFRGLVSSIDFVVELNPVQSPEYIVAGVVVVTCLALAIRYGPNTPRFSSRDQRLLAATAVALLINVDALATSGTRGSYKASAPAGTPVNSAILQARITPDAVGARNLIVIIVESLGVPNNAHDRTLFDRAWGAGRWSARYEVSSGTTPYYGSTTNAELREWCGTWLAHTDFTFDDARCLPHAFNEAGFRTVAMHSFSGDFFNRRAWYPKIGFEEQLFGPDLMKHGVPTCGGVFPGACDRDVPRKIGNLLRSSEAERHLVYWLTVNAHLPVPIDKSLMTDGCNLGTPSWRDDFPMLCRSYAIHQQVADSIHAEVMKTTFPEADILIVGDHMPPFFPRATRARFDSAKVPWIYLKSRAAVARRNVIAEPRT